MDAGTIGWQTAVTQVATALETPGVTVVCAMPSMVANAAVQLAHLPGTVGWLDNGSLLVHRTSDLGTLAGSALTQALMFGVTVAAVYAVPAPAAVVAGALGHHIDMAEDRDTIRLHAETDPPGTAPALLVTALAQAERGGGLISPVPHPTPNAVH